MSWTSQPISIPRTNSNFHFKSLLFCSLGSQVPQPQVSWGSWLPTWWPWDVFENRPLWHWNLHPGENFLPGYPFLPLHPAYVTLHPCNPASNYLHVPAENFTNTLVTQSVQQADNSFVLIHSISCETGNWPFGRERNILNQNQSRTDAMELIESSKECNPPKIPCGIASSKEVHIHSQMKLHHCTKSLYDLPPSHSLFEPLLSQLTFIDGIFSFWCVFSQHLLLSVLHWQSAHSCQSVHIG